ESQSARMGGDSNGEVEGGKRYRCIAAARSSNGRDATVPGPVGSTQGASLIPARRPIPDRTRKARIFAGGERNVSPGIGTSKVKSFPPMPPKLTLAVRYPSTRPTSFPPGTPKTPPPDAP